MLLCLCVFLFAGLGFWSGLGGFHDRSRLGEGVDNLIGYLFGGSGCLYLAI